MLESIFWTMLYSTFIVFFSFILIVLGLSILAALSGFYHAFKRKGEFSKSKLNMTEELQKILDNLHREGQKDNSKVH